MPLLAFCAGLGLAPPLDVQRIRAGRNSEVLLLRNKYGQWVVKHYHQQSRDPRDRLGTEFDFLTFLRANGVLNVAEPLGMNRALHYGLYSFLPGQRPMAVTTAHIDQATRFISAINENATSTWARALPKAADACMTWNDHLHLVHKRMRQLQAVKADLDVQRLAQAFVRDTLIPCWVAIQHALAQHINQSEACHPLAPESLIISPSDFGFHNTLEDAGTLSFVDFEYAGWDDPAKLICDFICQPEVPVSAAQGRMFGDKILRCWPHADEVSRRAQLMLPVHRLKWCCILLNEFKPSDRTRRSHAGIDSEDLLARQLAKSKQYFKLHLACTD